MAEKKLAGKVALITGGARGLGKGYALRIAQLGADVAVVDRNLKAFQVYDFEKNQMTAPTVMEECKSLGVRSMGLEVDLTDRQATERAVAEVVKEMGRIDIAVCNAGGARSSLQMRFSRVKLHQSGRQTPVTFPLPGPHRSVRRRC